MEAEFITLILFTLILIPFICLSCTEKGETEDEQEIAETTEDSQNTTNSISPEVLQPAIFETVNEAFEHNENILPPAYHDLFEINEQ